MAIGLLLPVSAVYAQQYDLLLDGGHLIDPKNGIDELMDVAIAGDSIAGVAPRISHDSAERVIDVNGLYVTPGIIDMHTHVFHGTDPDAYIADAHVSVAPDGFTFRSGVTTVVDAGSAGWKNFRTLKAQTIDRADTRVLAFLNIFGDGLTSGSGRYEMDDIDIDKTRAMIEAHPDLIVGTRVGHFLGESWRPVESAVQAALTIRAGQIVWDQNGLAAIPWEEE